jgi:D-amino-acid dehydrogenase
MSPAWSGRHDVTVIDRNDSLRGVDVAVIGGGAVGVCVAWELARGGASVALLERGPELAWGCSAGNAGIVGPSHVLPLAGPAAVRDGLRWMTRPDSPFYVRPSPAVVPWLGRFAAASAPARVRRSREVLRDLAIRSADLHAGLASAGLDTGYRQAGLLNVFSRESAFAAARRDALLDECDGIAHEVLAAEDVRTPPFAADFAGAILSPGEAHCDPHRFVTAVGNEARAAGVDIRTGVEVLELRKSGGWVDSLWTTAGDLPIGELVIAAGVWTPRFSSQLGVELPIEAGKGYHVDVPSGEDPELPIWLHEDRVVITPLDGRVRFAGTMELSGVNHDVSRRRVDAIGAAVGRFLPSLASRPSAHVWRGLRPCTPDGLPVIGRPPAIENATLAAGHGMWGLQLAPITAELVARVIAGDDGGSDLSPLRADRFQIRDRSPAEPPQPFMAGAP